MKYRIDKTSLLVAALCTLVFCGCDRKAERADASSTQPSAARAAVGSGPIEELTARDQDYCQLVEERFGPDGQTNVRAEQVASGLEVPWGLIFVDENNILVSERPGRLRLVQNGELVDEPVAIVEVAKGGEGGLLDIVAHPDFDTNHQFYLYRTVDDGSGPTNRVELWQLSQDGEALSARRRQVIQDDIPAARFHNGGRMRIGPDQMLYVGTGDAKQPDLAQNPSSLAGKVLRLTLEGEVPEDNPFENNPVYITGIRNTQGFDWRDPSTMIVTDHGPTGEQGRSGHDEVNIARGGTNLGWPAIYGCRQDGQKSPPSLVWQTAVPPGGAAVYTGEAIGDWKGSLLIGTLGSEHLHRVVFEEGTRRVERHETYFGRETDDSLGRLRDVTMGPDGHLYVTTSNCDGRGRCPPDGDKIFRIVPQ